MPAAKKSTTTKKRTTRKKAPAEPAAAKRLNKSLDAAQEALVALRKDVGKDVSTGAKELYSNVQKLVKDANRDSRKLGRALQKVGTDARKAAAPKRGTPRRHRPPQAGGEEEGRGPEQVAPRGASAAPRSAVRFALASSRGRESPAWLSDRFGQWAPSAACSWGRASMATSRTPRRWPSRWSGS